MRISNPLQTQQAMRAASKLFVPIQSSTAQNKSLYQKYILAIARVGLRDLKTNECLASRMVFTRIAQSQLLANLHNRG
jgi:hypothetical protein